MGQLNKEFRQTIIMITHNTEAAARADRVIEMRDGHVVRLIVPAGAVQGVS
jgi:putative ABC transport system ATP-binding protein